MADEMVVLPTHLEMIMLDAVAMPREETLQQEIEETKHRLSEKIETLEQQLHVTETVETAGQAVAATVEAVQATAEVVNGAVGKLHSALDLRSHVERHPWLCLGGSVAAGYLLTTWLTSRSTESSQNTPADCLDANAIPTVERAVSTPAVPVATPLASTATNGNIVAAEAANKAYHQAMLQTSPGYNLKVLALNTLMGVARELAARSVPKLAELVVSQLAQPIPTTTVASAPVQTIRPD